MKKFIDENGKLFGKVNIIDLAVIIILLCAIAGTLYKFKSPATNINDGLKTIHYQIKIRDVKKSSEQFYESDMKIYDSKTNNYLGTVKNVEAKDFYDYVTDINGVVHKSQKPDRIEILLDIEAEAIETNQSYLVGGTYELKCGCDIYIVTKYADVIGTVEKINSGD